MPHEHAADHERSFLVCESVHFRMSIQGVRIRKHKVKGQVEPSGYPSTKELE